MCLLLLCEVFQMTTVFSDCAAVCLEFLVKYLPSAASLPGIFVKCVLSDKALSTLQQVCQLSSSLPTDQISPFSGSKLLHLSQVDPDQPMDGSTLFRKVKWATELFFLGSLFWVTFLGRKMVSKKIPETPTATAALAK